MVHILRLATSESKGVSFRDLLRAHAANHHQRHHQRHHQDHHRDRHQHRHQRHPPAAVLNVVTWIHVEGIATQMVIASKVREIAKEIAKDNGAPLGRSQDQHLQDRPLAEKPSGVHQQMISRWLMALRSCWTKVGRFMEMVAWRRKALTTCLGGPLSSTLTFQQLTPASMQTSTQFPQASVPKVSSLRITATARRQGVDFAWRWIGLNPMETAVEPRLCIRRKALELTGALLGGAGQTSITMVRPLFICASSTVPTGVGPPSATARQLAEAA